MNLFYCRCCMALSYPTCDVCKKIADPIIPRVELEELVRALEDSEAQFAMPDPWPGKFAAEYRTKYLS